MDQLVSAVSPPNIGTVAANLHTLFPNGETYEVRVLDAHGRAKRTDAGYFTDNDAAARAVVPYDGNGSPYVTINPSKPDLLARASQRVATWARATTTDADIARRTHILFDFDPKRPPGISATDAEHDAALVEARRFRDMLSAEGWPAPILADSGNGAHLVYSVDLPNDATSTTLVERVLLAGALHVTDSTIDLDTSVYNAARITKVYGVLACKGDNTSERPHRRSALLDVPDTITPVPLELLQKMAAQAPVQPRGGAYAGSQPPVDRLLQEHGLVYREKPYINGGTLYVLDVCPFDANHTKSSSVIQWPNGARSFQCLHKSCRDKDWRAFREKLGIGGHPNADDGTENAPADGKPNATERVLRFIEEQGVTLFHTPMGDAYARCTIDGHPGVHSLTKGGSFKEKLSNWFYEATGKTTAERALADALGICRARALRNLPAVPVYTRVAPHDDGRVIFVDLADGTGRAIEIDATDWRIVKDPPVYFVRPTGTLPLPEPAEGGTLAALRDFANIQSDGDLALIAGWLLMTLHPKGPYPILAVSGEQGSAKTSLSRYLRSIVDPSVVPVRAAPRDEDTLVLAARNAHIVALDNMSHAGEVVADMLCRLATGGGLGKRTLYSNDEETLFYKRSPILLNGISDIATRGDLADRTVSVELATIPAEKRQSEEDVDAAFVAAHPALLGAVCEAASAALRNRGAVKLGGLPRMADFARWVAAAELDTRAKAFLGWKPGTFMTAYSENRDKAAEIALEASTLPELIRRLMDGCYVPKEGGEGKWCTSWHGTASDLLDVLKRCATPEEKQRDKTIPQNASSLATGVRRLAPLLRTLGGLDIQCRTNVGKAKRREIHITRVTTPPAGDTARAKGDTARAKGDTARAKGDTVARAGVSPVQAVVARNTPPRETGETGETAIYPSLLPTYIEKKEGSRGEQETAVQSTQKTPSPPDSLSPSAPTETPNGVPPSSVPEGPPSVPHLLAGAEWVRAFYEKRAQPK